MNKNGLVKLVVSLEIFNISICLLGGYMEGEYSPCFSTTDGKNNKPPT